MRFNILDSKIEMILYTNNSFYKKIKFLISRSYCKTSVQEKNVSTQTLDEFLEGQNSEIRSLLDELTPPATESVKLTPGQERFAKLTKKLLESSNEKDDLSKKDLNLGPDLGSPVVSSKPESSSDKLVEFVEKLLESSTKVGDLCKKPSSLESALIEEYDNHALDAKNLAEVAERLLDSSKRAEALSKKYAKLRDEESNSFSESSTVWPESSHSESDVESGSESSVLINEELESVTGIPSVLGKVQSSNCDSLPDLSGDFLSFIKIFEVFDFLLLLKYSVAINILGLLYLSYKYF